VPERLIPPQQRRAVAWYGLTFHRSDSTHFISETVHSVVHFCKKMCAGNDTNCWISNSFSVVKTTKLVSRESQLYCRQTARCCCVENRLAAAIVTQTDIAQLHTVFWFEDHWTVLSDSRFQSICFKRGRKFDLIFSHKQALFFCQNVVFWLKLSQHNLVYSFSDVCCNDSRDIFVSLERLKIFSPVHFQYGNNVVHGIQYRTQSNRIETVSVNGTALSATEQSGQARHVFAFCR